MNGRYLDLWHMRQLSAADFQHSARVGCRGFVVINAAGLAVSQQRLVLHKLAHLRALAAAERVGEPELEALLRGWACAHAAEQHPREHEARHGCHCAGVPTALQADARIGYRVVQSTPGSYERMLLVGCLPRRHAGWQSETGTPVLRPKSSSSL